MENADFTDVDVIIVGGGPSGLATAACLRRHGVEATILERDSCSASLWKRRTYDRLKLHLGKRFCSLPHFPFPPKTPTFVPKSEFISYLDNYVNFFDLRLVYKVTVETAEFDKLNHLWVVVTDADKRRVFRAKFLVVATGENGVPLMPKIAGLESFAGKVMHSSEYKSGKAYVGKKVLVVGCGNSGMEIAYDLACFGAQTAIVIRSAFHIVSKEILYAGMILLRYLPLNLIDQMVVFACTLKFGDLSKYRIFRPNGGPFFIKATTGRSAVIDVGTVEMIKNGQIQILPAIKEINEAAVTFSDGQVLNFDVILLATGYKSVPNEWLKDNNCLLKEDRYPSRRFPTHWKGKNGVYYAGFSRMGLAGCSMDAQNIADDVKMILNDNGN